MNDYEPSLSILIQIFVKLVAIGVIGLAIIVLLLDYYL